ncbi:MAG: universal stress protein [Gemmatimonadetes bacterium]|nr:universal stress protein [Gemmatimonadota bacterium]
MYRSILVPLDDSGFGEHALGIALGIARRAGARLEFAHVHVPMSPRQALAGPPLDAGETTKREAAYLQALLGRVRSAGVECGAEILEGAIVDALLRSIHDRAVDLVVMATHGRDALQRAWFGGIADPLVRRSGLPVLLARASDDAPPARWEDGFTEILVPLDGSTLAEQVLEHAIALGTPGFTRYTLLRVETPLPVVRPYAPIANGADLAVTIRTRTAAEAYLAGIARRLRARRLEVRAEAVIASNPATAIVEYALAQPVELIALATHGRGGLSRLLLGSMAERLVRTAPAPVLLFRPGAKVGSVRRTRRNGFRLAGPVGLP